MKITPFWASIALLRASAVFAQTTGTAEPSATSTSAAPSCTASLVTTLCEYKSPGSQFAVASSGKDHCWAYCKDNGPCNFVIFAAGNPYTGTGTCWLYPGETFDKSAGSTEGCQNQYLSVYEKVQCAGTPTAGDCAATETPSAVAEVCGYPAPEDCFYTCVASNGAQSCLSQCAKADSCAYAVFNPRTESGSPYAPGTCWIYTNGTFDSKSTTTCTGKPEQYVYNNVCPKPFPASSSASSSSLPSASATASNNSRVAQGNAQDAAESPITSQQGSAPKDLSPIYALAVGTAVLIGLGL